MNNKNNHHDNDKYEEYDYDNFYYRRTLINQKIERAKRISMLPKYMKRERENNHFLLRKFHFGAVARKIVAPTKFADKGYKKWAFIRQPKDAPNMTPKVMNYLSTLQAWNYLHKYLPDQFFSKQLFIKDVEERGGQIYSFQDQPWVLFQTRFNIYAIRSIDFELEMDFQMKEKFERQEKRKEKDRWRTLRGNYF